MAGEGDKSIDLDKYYQLTQIDEYVVRYVKVGNGPTPIFGFPGLLGKGTLYNYYKCNLQHIKAINRLMERIAFNLV